MYDPDLILPNDCTDCYVFLVHQKECVSCHWPMLGDDDGYKRHAECQRRFTKLYRSSYSLQRYHLGRVPEKVRENLQSLADKEVEYQVGDDNQEAASKYLSWYHSVEHPYNASYDR